MSTRIWIFADGSEPKSTLKSNHLRVPFPWILNQKIKLNKNQILKNPTNVKKNLNQKKNNKWTCAWNVPMEFGLYETKIIITTTMSTEKSRELNIYFYTYLFKRANWMCHERKKIPNNCSFKKQKQNAININNQRQINLCAFENCALILSKFKTVCSSCPTSTNIEYVALRWSFWKFVTFSWNDIWFFYSLTFCDNHEQLWTFPKNFQTYTNMKKPEQQPEIANEKHKTKNQSTCSTPINFEIVLHMTESKNPETR